MTSWTFLRKSLFAEDNIDMAGKLKLMPVEEGKEFFNRLRVIVDFYNICKKEKAYNSNRFTDIQFVYSKQRIKESNSSMDCNCSLT